MSMEARYLPADFDAFWRKNAPGELAFPVVSASNEPEEHAFTAGRKSAENARILIASTHP